MDILSICNVEPKAEIQYAGADDKTHGTNMQNSIHYYNTNSLTTRIALAET
jgi:type V secretory pathway adhesin AidA